jgi:hypothetical protein
MTHLHPARGRLALLASLLLPFAPSCASSRSAAPSEVAVAELSAANGWAVVSDVPFEHQRDATACGSAALAMVLKHYGVDVRQDEILATSRGSAPGADELRDFARAQGLAAFLFSGDLEIVVHELQQDRPVIVALARGKHGEEHYEVVVGYNVAKGELATVDPSRGYTAVSLRDFIAAWQPIEQLMIAVLPRPMPGAHPGGPEGPEEHPSEQTPTQSASWGM